MTVITDTQLIIEKIKKGAMDIDTAIFNDLIEQHKSTVKTVTEMRNLFKGNHKILQKEKKGTRPNNRLVFNFPKIIILFALNYLLGNKHKYNIALNEDHPDYQKASFFLEEIKKINTENNEEALLREIYKYMLIDKRSWELVYIDSEGRIRLKYCPESEVIPVFDGSKDEKLSLAIRYWTEQVKESDVDEVRERIRIELYDEKMVYNYIQTEDNKFILDKNKPPYPHFFDEVPLIPYQNAIDESDLDDIQTLVNDYEEKRSERSNDLEYAADSYLWLNNVLLDIVNDDELTPQQKEYKIAQMINSRLFQTTDTVHYSDDDTPLILKATIQFITKELMVEPLKDHLDDLRRTIYQVSMTPSIFDQSNFSNVAEATLRLFFIPADIKADNNEPRLKAGIRKRLRLISQILFKKTGIHYDPTWIEVEFFRNRIINETELINNINSSYMSKTIDLQTAVEKHPLVDNPESVIERLKKEQEEKEQRYTQDWSLLDHGEMDEDEE